MQNRLTPLLAMKLRQFVIADDDPNYVKHYFKFRNKEGEDEEFQNRRGAAIDTVVSGGCILSGGTVKNSVLARGVKVHAGAVIEDSIILDNCDIGRRSHVRRAILDKNVRVPQDSRIGFDLDYDRKHYHVTESGIVVVEGNRSPVDVVSINV